MFSFLKCSVLCSLFGVRNFCTSREPIDVITIGSYLFCGEYVLVSFSLFGWPLSISPEERESHQTARRHIRLQWQPHRILHYHFTRPAYTFDISYYTTPSIIIITPRRIKFSEWPDGTTQKPVIALVQLDNFRWIGGYLVRR